MENKVVENWFDELRRLWLAKDIKSVRNLLSENVQYYENPFKPPLIVWQDIEKAWQEIKRQDISELEIKPLIIKDNEGTASYTFAYRDPAGHGFKSKGAYYVKLDSEGRAVEFRQWWVNN